MGTRQKTPIEDDMCDVVKALNLNQLVLVNDTVSTIISFTCIGAMSNTNQAMVHQTGLIY